MRTRILPLAGLLAVTLTVSLLVSCSDGTGTGPAGDGERSDDSSGAESYSVDSTNSLLADAEQAPSAFGAIPGSGGVAAESVPDSLGGAAQNLIIDRQIIRTATIELTVDDVPGAVQRIELAASTAGGFVSGSSITIEQQPPPDDPDEEQEIRQRGTITIRVPAESYASVMNTLRGIVADPRDMTSLTEDTSEVTEEYADLQARVRNLEATETQYLELLSRAESISDVLLVQDRLNSVRLEIEQVTGRIQLLDDLTSMATITTFLTLPPLVVLPVEPEPDPQSWAEEAWENAWNASEDVGEALGVAAITGGVLLVWLIIPGALFLGGWWIFRSRRGPSDTAV